jgi:regulatory protein
MSKITAIQLNKSRKRVNVFFDNSSIITINKSVVEEMGLRKGMDVSCDKIKELTQANQFHSCLEIAVRYVAYRTRSELELRQRLYRRGFQNDTIKLVLDKLKNQGIIDDEMFAVYWRESRLATNPKSRRLLKYELQKKGIASELADKAVGDMDDIAAAYKAGLKKARILTASNYPEFTRRLSNYLKWRGFNFEVIDVVSKRLWQEKQTGT